MSVTSIGAAKAANAADPAVAGQQSALAKVAKEFEGVLVRQLLQASKVAGQKTEGGYDAMALDAMCNGVMKGGGLGLARSLEAALLRAVPHTMTNAGGTSAAKGTAPEGE